MNVAELIFERAAQYPTHTALLEGEKAISYAELDSRSMLISNALRSILSAHGPHCQTPRVGLQWSNGINYVLMALAILRSGSCLIPVARELAPAEQNHQIRLTANHLLVSEPGPDQPTPEPGMEMTAGLRWVWQSLSEPPSFPEDRFSALGPAFVRFSSGTTGESKGVVLGHHALRERVQSANRRLKISKSDKVLWTLPMAHHFAVSIVLYLLEGATTVLEESHLAEDILRTARRTGATVLYASPFHHALLAADTSGASWETLRLAVSTASSLREATALQFAQRYGVALTQGLGIIEAGLPLLNQSPSQKPLSVGCPDDCEIRLIREDGSESAPGELGELHLRGPGFFDAYLVPWTERAHATKEGWFCTGDLAVRDPEGFVFLRGRKKSVINFGGMKFFPEEVEQVLNSHPEIAESRVSGEAHDQWNQIPVAEVVAKNPTVRPSAASMSKHCRALIASYKVPVRFRFVEQLPRTASGKLKR